MKEKSEDVRGVAFSFECATSQGHQTRKTQASPDVGESRSSNGLPRRQGPTMKEKSEDVRGLTMKGKSGDARNQALPQRRRQRSRASSR